MDSTFSTLRFVIFGISISFYALVVQSEIQNRNNADSPAPRTPPPPPSATPPPPPSPSTPESPPPHLFPPPPPPHRRRPPPHRRPPPGGRRIKRSPPPPPPNHEMNPGKKVGLLFLGIAGIMQVGMVVFLVFKRRQLLSTNDRYDTCS